MKVILRLTTMLVHAIDRKQTQISRCTTLIENMKSRRKNELISIWEMLYRLLLQPENKNFYGYSFGICNTAVLVSLLSSVSVVTRVRIVFKEELFMILWTLCCKIKTFVGIWNHLTYMTETFFFSFQYISK